MLFDDSYPPILVFAPHKNVQLCFIIQQHMVIQILGTDWLNVPVTMNLPLSGLLLQNVSSSPPPPVPRQVSYHIPVEQILASAGLYRLEQTEKVRLGLLHCSTG